MGAKEDAIEHAVAERRERLRARRAAHELLNTPDEDGARGESKDNGDGSGEDKDFSTLLFYSL
ncbi:hypothetical protein AKJ16_DCAP14260 [Drosera capensis]